MTKWKNICELCRKIDEDDTLEKCVKELRIVSYAPNIGYRAWIFKYKKTLVALLDIGNSHWAFYSAVTRFDLLSAKVSDLVERLKYRKEAKR